jgi:hypothetical protein
MTAGYIVATGIGSATLFFVLLWLFTVEVNDETPWVSAGLAASVFLLICVAIRELFIRRANVRAGAHADRWETASGEHASNRTGSRTIARNSAALRSLHKLSSDADGKSTPELHLDAFHGCEDYLASTEELLRGGEITRETRAVLRSGQERVRAMHRHHMIMWARSATRQIVNDAQQRVRLSDKIETALRGLQVLKTALQHFPDERELKESAAAIEEFIASAKVSHWVELAERNVFRGQFRRAIHRYRDALFYLSRENVREELRLETSERISREIEMLRARLRTSQPVPSDQSARSEKGNELVDDWKTVS